jgi:hypothetical protein
MPPKDTEIQIAEAGPQTFALVVVFDGQRFDCGTYINRMAAVQAGKLFVQRKEGEQAGRQKRPRKKG